MVSAELGTKRTCPSCAARFYDLLKNPIVCPKCGVSFVAEALLPSKGEHAPVVHKVREPVVAEETEEADIELVSLEDVDEGGEEEGEDVEIGGSDAGDEVFLEEEEEEGNVSGIIGGGKGGEEEP
ncbi:MAG: TIGR02300 family protein [Hyphomicrobiales bacterium]